MNPRIPTPRSATVVALDIVEHRVDLLVNVGAAGPPGADGPIGPEGPQGIEGPEGPRGPPDEAPINGVFHGRQDATWVPLPPLDYLPLADPIVTDAPYLRLVGGTVTGATTFSGASDVHGVERPGAQRSGLVAAVDPRLDRRRRRFGALAIHPRRSDGGNGRQRRIGLRPQSRQRHRGSSLSAGLAYQPCHRCGYVWVYSEHPRRRGRMTSFQYQRRRRA